MKIKKALFFLLMTIYAYGSQAQCIPDTSITHNDPGIYPDSATNLPHAIVGIPYVTDIQMKVLTDTVSYIGPIPVPVTIDSIKITSITLPAGYSHDCNPPTCNFPGGSDVCIQLSGPAPTPAEVGNIYPISVTATAYGHITGTGTQVPSQAQNIDYYYIQVDDNVNILVQEAGEFNAGVFPNPALQSTSVIVNLPADGAVEVRIIDPLGRTVQRIRLKGLRGLNSINMDVSDLSSGLYRYQVYFRGKTAGGLLVVGNE